MGDWLHHMFNTPMNDLRWWEQTLAYLFLASLVLGPYAVVWYRTRPPKGTDR